jgi:hypothetical protein
MTVHDGSDALLHFFAHIARVSNKRKEIGARVRCVMSVMSDPLFHVVSPATGLRTSLRKVHKVTAAFRLTGRSLAQFGHMHPPSQFSDSTHGDTARSERPKGRSTKTPLATRAEVE